VVLPNTIVDDALTIVVVDVEKLFCTVLVTFINCATGTGGRELCDEKIPHESGFHQAADAIEGVNATNANIRKYFFINSSGV